MPSHIQGVQTFDPSYITMQHVQRSPQRNVTRKPVLLINNGTEMNARSEKIDVGESDTTYQQYIVGHLLRFVRDHPRLHER